MPVEVALTEWTSDGSIRHPSFQGLCEDKNPKEVMREEPTSGKSKKTRSDHAESSVLSRSFRTASFGVLTPRCSHSRTFVTVSVCLIALRTSPLDGSTHQETLIICAWQSSFRLGRDSESQSYVLRSITSILVTLPSSVQSMEGMSRFLPIGFWWLRVRTRSLEPFR
jgi:hypothetical protein